jgi:hypothetical protein
VRVLCHQRGSVIAEVALSAAEGADSRDERRSAAGLADELVRQAMDPGSVLRSKAVGQLCRRAEVHGPVAEGVCVAVAESQRELVGLLEQAQREAKSSVRKGEAAEAEAGQLRGEMGRLQRLVEHMVDRTALETARDEAESRGMEVERMGRLVQSMVPRAHYETALDDMRRAEAEAERLSKRLAGMVPREQAQAEQEEVAALREEIERLRAKLAVERRRQAEHQAAEDLRAAAEPALVAREEELRRLQQEQGRTASFVAAYKEGTLQTMHSLVQAAADQSSALALLETLRGDMLGMVPLARAQAAEAEAAALEAALGRFLEEGERMLGAVDALVREASRTCLAERERERVLQAARAERAAQALLKV